MSRKERQTLRRLYGARTPRENGAAPSLWLLLSLPAGALCVLTRGYPTTSSDAGIFLSVEGRLLAGERLYRDVFDNKDPLFYYGQALALWVLGWRGPFLLDIAWLVVASAGAHLLLRAVTGDLVVAVFGQLLYPLLLTGTNYYAGYSETPALSLLPLFAYLIYRRKPKLAGCVVGVIFFLKVTVLPVAAAIALVGLVFDQETRHLRLGRELLSFLGATAATVSSIFLALALRGEAGPYLATFGENSAYASNALRIESWPPGIRGHLAVVRDLTPHLSRGLALAALGLIVILAAGSADARARLFRSRLFAFSLAASLSTLIVLAETALWDHALEALAFPIFLCAALALDCVRTVARGSPARLVERLAVGVVGCGFLLVALWPRPSIEYVKAWAAPPTMIVSDALQRAAEPTGARNSDVSYMHLGTNDDEAQGAFLPASFRLACPRFHQYPFTPWRALRQTILCIQRERPQLIAVTPSFTTNSWTYSGRSPPPAWRQFVLAGKAYLRSHCAAFVTNEAVQVYRCRGRLRLDE